MLYYDLFFIQRFCYPSWISGKLNKLHKQAKVRFWSNIERVVIIHLNMLTVIMLAIIIYCIKASNNVQHENNVWQNVYPWH